MSAVVDRLYALLPAIHRIRDAERGEPLKALLSVIAEQIEVLEEDLQQRYDDHFIETCAEWAIPYLGDLVGYRPMHGVAPAVSSPRAEVAHTIAYRRRKGTAAMLEQMARDVSGWDASVVEYFQRLSTTQYMNHVRPRHACTPDLRRGDLLERLHGPLDTVPHTVDVRHIATGDGLYNIPNIGIFLWRVRAYPLHDSPAVPFDPEHPDGRYLFSPVGCNMPLYTRPETETEITHLAGRMNLPLPISRRVLAEHLSEYYGPGKSFLLKRVDAAGNLVEVPADEIEVCDLRGRVTWAHVPRSGSKIAVDPVLGRIALPAAQAGAALVVSFHYGFSGPMGGGEYARDASLGEPALDTEIVTRPRRVIEIGDNGRYEVSLPEQGTIELRAADRQRPTIVLGGAWEIFGDEGTEVTLSGLLIVGGPLRVPEKNAQGRENRLRRLRLRHCTLVPGLALDVRGLPTSPGSPSLVADVPGLVVEIDHCIVGSLRVRRDAEVVVADSIIDGTSDTAVAYASPDDETAAGGEMEIQDSTVIGRVHTVFLRLASNTIFDAVAVKTGDWEVPVRSERKQNGCVRFSYVPLRSIVPRRYRCQPASAEDADRVRPQFTSRRYGDPGYGQLSRGCPPEIRLGADDQGDMGAFHGLHESQRESNVRARIDEHLRFGLEAGVMFAPDQRAGDRDEW